jgi:hypothetical protein
MASWLAREHDLTDGVRGTLSGLATATSAFKGCNGWRGEACDFDSSQRAASIHVLETTFHPIERA